MILALALAAFVAQAPAAQSSAAVLAEIRVQGNVVTTDADVIRLSGLRIGEPVDDTTTRTAADALESSHQFAHVEVLQRFASISDPTQILIVIIVDEGPLRLSGSGNTRRIVRSRGPHLLFMPVLGYEEGYGLAYGARVAKLDPVGPRSRLSFPLTWGGDKRAEADLDKELVRGPLTRAQASFSVSRRTNPFFDQDDSRLRTAIRGERQIAKSVVAGVFTGMQRVSFMGEHERFSDSGVDAVADTRLDPFLARNAVYARAAWDRIGTHGGACCHPLSPASAPSVHETTVEGRGYIGLPGQSILVLRGLRENADRQLPLYLKPLLGGMDTLRGFRAGYKVGDTVVAESVELRAPLTSPLGIAKFGVRAFVDAGTAYQHGERYVDQRIDRGAGGGIWFTATAFRLNLDVAHGVGASTRVHFGTSLSF